MEGLTLALVLFGIFALLKTVAERLKTGDKGEPIGLGIDAQRIHTDREGMKH